MKYVSLYAISKPKLNLDVIWRLNSLLSLKNREFWQFWATQFFVICYCFASKGQIISECPYEIIVSPIRPTKKISEISALASKERSNQKNKGTLLY